MPNPVSQTLSSATTEVLKVRTKNPAITLNHKLSVNRAEVEWELITYNAKRTGVDLGPKSSPRRGMLPAAVEAVVSAVKMAANAGANAVEWIKNGQAVPPDLSTRRAFVCSGCPCNDMELAGRWYMVPVSEAVRTALEQRADLKLSTPYDDKLGSCSACHCPMPVKVHEPLDLILKHTSEEVKAKLDKRCWILHEQP